MPNLCQSFKDLSRWTWAILQAGGSHHISIGETTLTDILLITLAYRHPQEVLCQKRPDEHVTGADYDLHFFSPGSYFGIRIQAKRLYPVGDLNWNYPSLNVAQANNLIGNPRPRTLTPLYCFYNWWDAASYHPTYNGDVSDFGCAVAEPSMVLRAMMTASGTYWHKTLRRHLPNMTPWHKLVCPADIPLPQRVRRAIVSLPRDPSEPPAVPEVRSRPPSLVRRLLQARDGVVFPRDYRSYFATSENESVRGFVLIAETDLKEIARSFE